MFIVEVNRAYGAVLTACHESALLYHFSNSQVLLTYTSYANFGLTISELVIWLPEVINLYISNSLKNASWGCHSSDLIVGFHFDLGLMQGLNSCDTNWQCSSGFQCGCRPIINYWWLRKTTCEYGECFATLFIFSRPFVCQLEQV